MTYDPDPYGTDAAYRGPAGGYFWEGSEPPQYPTRGDAWWRTTDDPNGTVGLYTYYHNGVGYQWVEVTNGTVPLAAALTENDANALYLRLDGSVPMQGPVTVPSDPVEALQLATKQYVDNAIGGPYVALDGSTPMQGPLILYQSPVDDNEAANKAYVDSEVTQSASALTSYIDSQDLAVVQTANTYTDQQIGALDSSISTQLGEYARLDGAAFTGPVQGIDPTLDEDFATKGYVDANAGGGGGGSVDLSADYDWTGEHTFAAVTTMYAPAINSTYYPLYFRDITGSNETYFRFINRYTGTTGGGYLAIDGRASGVSGPAVNQYFNYGTAPSVRTTAQRSIGEVATLDVRASSPLSSVEINLDGVNQVFDLNVNELTLKVPIELPSDPTTALHAATKQYVDNAIAAAIAAI